MENKTYYQVRVVIDSSLKEEIHSDGLSKDEADTLCADLNRLFPNNVYHVTESYDYKEPVERHYNDNAVDGWEDLINY